MCGVRGAKQESNCSKARFPILIIDLIMTAARAGAQSAQSATKRRDIALARIRRAEDGLGKYVDMPGMDRLGQRCDRSCQRSAHDLDDLGGEFRI